MKQYIIQAIKDGYSAVVVRKERNVRNSEFAGDLDRITNKFHGKVKQAVEEINKNMVLWAKYSKVIKHYKEKTPDQILRAFKQLDQYRKDLVLQGISTDKLDGNLRVTKEKEAADNFGDPAFCDVLAENERVRIKLEALCI
jgi:uncharacterized short protein YbdD (DUF466 family)